MIGVLVFLGCTWRLYLRLGGGDLNALTGIAGLGAGVGLGAWFRRRGYSLGPAGPAPWVTAAAGPAVMAALLALVVAGVRVGPDGPPFASASGPGSMHASVLVALAVGAVAGVLLQRSRFCTVGAFGRIVTDGDLRLLGGVAALAAGAFAANLVLGQFHAGMAGMPIAHSNHLWNLLGMALAGLAFYLAGGCPGRQLVLCGEGSTDAAIFILGSMVAAGMAHTWGLTAAPDKAVEGAVSVGGPALWGQVTVGVGLAFCVVLGLTSRRS
jgi:YedE family putative selenium metabolism protein